VSRATVSVLDGRADVTIDVEVTGARPCISAIEDIGFEAALYVEDSSKRMDKTAEVTEMCNRFLLSCVFSVPVFLISMVLPKLNVFDQYLQYYVCGVTMKHWAKLLLVTPAQFGVGWRFHHNAYKALARGTANMDVLVSLGTNTAYWYSLCSILACAASPVLRTPNEFLETSTMLITFILLGKALEMSAKGRTSQAITKLMNLAPTKANLLHVDAQGEVIKEEVIDASLVMRNDVLKVYPGGKMVTDGEVVLGESEVDESMITGESLPVPKGLGDQVIGGTLNGSGLLHVRATRVGAPHSAVFPFSLPLAICRRIPHTLLASLRPHRCGHLCTLSEPHCWNPAWVVGSLHIQRDCFAAL
ncbi:copper-transporting ATPase, partial [Cymbomonas tetramitiformis]